MSDIETNAIFTGKMQLPQTELTYFPMLIHDWFFTLCDIIFVAELLNFAAEHQKQRRTNTKM